jgi:hypothetical protein
VAGGQINSKSEARSTKQIQNPNLPMFETISLVSSLSFGHLDFENLKIVSDFDIRISDFIMSIQNWLPKDWASLE